MFVYCEVSAEHEASKGEGGIFESKHQADKYSALLMQKDHPVASFLSN